MNPLPTWMADILREADQRGLLDGYLLVSGSTAMTAYSVVAGRRLTTASDEAQSSGDLDVTWMASQRYADSPLPIFDLLKSVDPSFSVCPERPFRALNSLGREFDLLAASSSLDFFPFGDMLFPHYLPEQDWLRIGMPLEAHVLDANEKPVRMVVPDPRMFGLLKLWVSRQLKRKVAKRARDARHGVAVLQAAEEMMGRYPMDAAFEADLPEELRDFREWIREVEDR